MTINDKVYMDCDHDKQLEIFGMTREDVIKDYEKQPTFDTTTYEKDLDVYLVNLLEWAKTHIDLLNGSKYHTEIAMQKINRAKLLIYHNGKKREAR
tara:strand:+ start:396 stop:683 length:288 start_codon:yes stop_codon:yes gene_type:complete